MPPKRALSGGATRDAKKSTSAAFPLARLPMPAGWTLPDENFAARDFGPAAAAAAEVGEADKGKRCVAAFDFDGCLSPRGGKETMQFPQVPDVLRELHKQNYRIVIVTNESIDLLKKEEARRNCVLKKTGRLDAFMEEVGVPCLALIAFAKDEYRTPDVGAWTYVRSRYQGRELDMAGSFFVGDAAGRPGDYSEDSDLVFARNVGVRFFNEQSFFVGGERM
jgi:bifunctional polynucleotide phosphatase/kinase